MKQPQSNTALLAHKWTFTQFSSGRTLRPQRTQLLSIAVTPFGPASALAEGPLPLRYAFITHPFSVRPPSQNHQGVAPNFRAPTRVTLRACQALSRVRLALARLQWSASATTILTADRAIALVADSVSFAQRQEPAPCLVGGRRLGACPSGRRYRGAVPCAHGWSKRRTAAG